MINLRLQWEVKILWKVCEFIISCSRVTNLGIFRTDTLPKQLTSKIQEKLFLKISMWRNFCQFKCCVPKETIFVWQICARKFCRHFWTFSVCPVSAKNLRKWLDKVECLESDLRTPGPQIGPNLRHLSKSNPKFGSN